MGGTSIVDLVCADVCRIVMQGVSRSSRATNFSWAPGERSPTAISPPGTYAGVIGARINAGHLAVAYWARGATSQGGLTVGLARGDLRGAHLRLGRSITAPPSLLGSAATGIALEGVPAGTFGPGGFAAVTVYSGGQPYKVAVRLAILPL